MWVCMARIAGNTYVGTGMDRIAGCTVCVFAWTEQQAVHLCVFGTDRIAGCSVCVFGMDRKANKHPHQQIVCGQASRWERKSMKKDKQETMSEVAGRRRDIGIRRTAKGHVAGEAGGQAGEQADRQTC
jgi:hypothetical protein